MKPWMAGIVENGRYPLGEEVEGFKVGDLAGVGCMVGSLIGGIAETQEMLDFGAEHDVVADVEMIRMDQIDGAYERVLAGDVKFRFVIDTESMPAAV